MPQFSQTRTITKPPFQDTKNLLHRTLFPLFGLKSIRISTLGRSCLKGVVKQIPENLSRKGCAPIIGKPRGVTWSAYIFVVFYSGDHSYADPQTALSP